MAAIRSEPGAPPPDGFIPLSVPVVQGNEWAYVKECLDTGWVSSAGSFVDRFEQNFAAYLGSRAAVATVNGTSALHLALLVAGIEPEDEVLVSALTFIAPVNAVRYCGAWPVFIDADPRTWLMNPEHVTAFLENECHWKNGSWHNKHTGRRVRAILPVHILGHPCDMDPILAIGRKMNLTVIEDATESLGARYRERMVGTLGDIACFSFNGNKLITTGGGGMLVTENRAWAERARYLATQAKDDPVEYIHHEVGFNYRLTNVQAAIGVAQMEQLPHLLEVRRRIAEQYHQGLAGISGLTLPSEAPWASSTFWLYTVLVDQAGFGLDSRGLMKYLAAERIQSRPLWSPVHRARPYAKAFAYRVEVADRIQAMALSLPSSSNLTVEQVQRVIDTIRAAGRRSNQ